MYRKRVFFGLPATSPAGPPREPGGMKGAIIRSALLVSLGRDYRLLQNWSVQIIDIPTYISYTKIDVDRVSQCPSQTCVEMRARRRSYTVCAALLCLSQGNNNFFVLWTSIGLVGSQNCCGRGVSLIRGNNVMAPLYRKTHCLQ